MVHLVMAYLCRLPCDIERPQLAIAPLIGSLGATDTDFMGQKNIKWTQGIQIACVGKCMLIYILDSMKHRYASITLQNRIEMLYIFCGYID